MSEQDIATATATIIKSKRGRKKKSEIQPSGLKAIKRNSFGLIEGMEYQFDNIGLVDWRKMVKPEFLVPNSLNFTKKGLEIPKSIEGLDDENLLITLAGVKQLAFLRGYKNVTYSCFAAAPDYVALKCSILWIPNYETEDREILFEGTANVKASEGNKSLYDNYLCAVAENRSFSRCVRAFLRINIVTNEELDSLVSDKTIPIPKEDSKIAILKLRLKEKGITWDQLRQKLRLEGFKEINEIQKIEDLPEDMIFKLLDRLKDYNPVPE